MPSSNVSPDRRIPSLYRSPTLGELIDLALDIGLISDLERDSDRIRMTCKEEEFDLTPGEAELLVKGLLLGYFALNTRDDLGLASWEI